MLPHEVIPALPRQKVKNKKTGQVGDVILLETVNGADFLEVLVTDAVSGERYFESFPLKDCEIVPEEPRPLRVGDAVMTPERVFTRVAGVYSDGSGVIVEGASAERYKVLDKKSVRRATPEEISRHFAPNA